MAFSDEKNRFRVTLEDKVMDVIDDIKEEQNLKYNGDAITFLVNEYKRLKNEQWSLNYVAEVVSNNLHKILKEELTRVRLGTNNTDRNTQILIELVNGMMIHDNVEDIMTTDQLESDGLVTAKNMVQERIENKRQKRVEWEASRQK
ncbi:lipopolysaccharide biosynthesis regulator YciM [Peribacillus simplex]|uniref:hypothetical protein n=1 Tax=Peribacillus simplex TaxID=1478 RepID=UPI0024E1D1EF|nr:hypothetical protein [Peribacillus simplex]MDF9763736.1 lipopolysaccharide biosynthesis regulator YciM [Peribacillus simplex]MDF9763751.1 lipopolysaccharide biosynthesis regulator YciM [Peribacillus simplex]